MSAPRDAATVLLLRDRQDGAFEVLLVKRHGASGFMAGAHVFPGGKLDAGDCAPELLARTAGRSPEQAQAALAEAGLAPELALGLFAAAARETFEESGLLLAAELPHAELVKVRSRLHQGLPFHAALGALNAYLRLDWLVPFARWITPEVEPRRFDTRFFLARAPAEQSASHDERETTEHAWLSPAEALAALDRGQLLLPPPTLHSLHWLASFATSEQALRRAAERPPPRVEPVITQLEGQLSVLLPGDPLHPVGQATLEGPTRMVLAHGRFWAK